MRIFIDGLYPLVEPILKKLLSDHNISHANLLVNTYNRKECDHVKKWMSHQKISWFERNYNRETIGIIKNFHPDIILSVYGLRIIPYEVLELVDKDKQFNMHPSFLPDYKGRMIIPWVIINCEQYHGITYHQMTDQIDVGNILYQEKFLVPEKITAIDLFYLTCNYFIKSFNQVFEDLCNNSLTKYPMPEGGRYYNKDLPFDGKIDTAWSDKFVEKFIRAMHFPPYKAALFEYKNKFIECKTFDEFKLLKKNIQNISQLSK